MPDPIGDNFTTPDGREIVHYAEYHWPKVYRYEVADRGPRFALNQYANQFTNVTIGLAVVIGRYAYCVKWAHARVRFA
ncbi:hypothetical protein [Streptomyces cinereoruber]|uniref:hypothetical protein n=1 Tax=Streptomyces cinereoruber TaxID=67260 RepID=UPI00362FD5A9